MHVFGLSMACKLPRPRECSRCRRLSTASRKNRHSDLSRCWNSANALNCPEQCGTVLNRLEQCLPSIRRLMILKIPKILKIGKRFWISKRILSNLNKNVHFCKLGKRCRKEVAWRRNFPKCLFKSHEIYLERRGHDVQALSHVESLQEFRNRTVHWQGSWMCCQTGNRQRWICPSET